MRREAQLNVSVGKQHPGKETNAGGSFYLKQKDAL
jgi:hypothetical protein